MVSEAISFDVAVDLLSHRSRTHLSTASTSSHPHLPPLSFISFSLPTFHQQNVGEKLTGRPRTGRSSSTSRAQGGASSLLLAPFAPIIGNLLRLDCPARLSHFSASNFIHTLLEYSRTHVGGGNGRRGDPGEGGSCFFPPPPPPSTVSRHHPPEREKG